MKKDINNRIIGIFKIFILIQPVLNVFIYFFQSNILSLIRPLFVGILVILLLLNKDIKKSTKIFIIIYMIVFVIYSIMHLYIIKDSFYERSYGTIINEVEYLIRYGYYMLLLFSSYLILKISNKEERKNILKTLIISIIIMVILYYASILTNTSPLTYGISDVKFGWIGWSNSSHYHANALVLILSVIILGFFEKDLFPKWVKYVFTILIVGCSYFFVGTKTGTYGTIIVVGFYFLIELVKMIKLKKINTNGIFITILFCLLTIALPYTYGSKNMDNQQDVSQINNLYSQYDFINNAISNPIKEQNEFSKKTDKVLNDIKDKTVKAFDNRKIQKDINEKLRNESTIMEKLFGYGFQNLPKNIWVETDFYILYYSFGIIGSMILLGFPIIYLIYLMIINVKKVFKLNSSTWLLGFCTWLNIGILVIVGYVLYFAQTVMYFVLPFALLCIDLEEIKHE